MEVKVLLVDDEQEFVDTLSDRLESRGFQVLKAYSGEDAVELIHSCDLDVIVLDLQMPGINGVEVLRVVKNTNPFIEVIMLTGHATMESAISGLQIGAFDYLLKPADTKELISKIMKAHQRKCDEEQRALAAGISNDIVAGN